MSSSHIEAHPGCPALECSNVSQVRKWIFSILLMAVGQLAGTVVTLIVVLFRLSEGRA